MKCWGWWRESLFYYAYRRLKRVQSAYSIDILYDSIPLVTAYVVRKPSADLVVLALQSSRSHPTGVRVAAASPPRALTGEEDLVSITFRAGNVVGVSGLVPQVSMMLDPDGKSQEHHGHSRHNHGPSSGTYPNTPSAYPIAHSYGRLRCRHRVRHGGAGGTVRLP